MNPLKSGIFAFNELKRIAASPAAKKSVKRLGANYGMLYGMPVIGSPLLARLFDYGQVKESSASAGSGISKSADDTSAGSDALAYTGSLIAPQVTNMAVAYPVLRGINKSKKGFPLMMLPDNVDSPLPGTAAHKIESLTVEGVPIRKWLRSHGVSLSNSTKFGPFAGPAFIPKSPLNSTPQVLLGFSPKASDMSIKGTTGHEIGHVYRSLSGKLHPTRYMLSKNIGGLVSAVGALRNSRKDADPREAAFWAAGSVLSSAPMLNEEFQASRVGSKLIGLKGLRRLHAFKGLPSYIAGASAPGIAYGVRRLIERIRNKS